MELPWNYIAPVGLQWGFHGIVPTALKWDFHGSVGMMRVVFNDSDVQEAE